MNVPAWKLPSPRRTRLVGLPIAARAPTRGRRHGYSPAAEEAKEKKKKTGFSQLFFVILFSFFSPLKNRFDQMVRSVKWPTGDVSLELQ